MFTPPYVISVVIEEIHNVTWIGLISFASVNTDFPYLRIADPLQHRQFQSLNIYFQEINNINFIVASKFFYCNNGYLKRPFFTETIVRWVGCWVKLHSPVFRPYPKLIRINGILFGCIVFKTAVCVRSWFY